MEYKRICQVCGKEYRYCVYCEEFNDKPKWMMLFHDDNCRKIFHAVSDYLAGESDAETTKNLLNDCDITNPERFNRNVQKVISELFAEKTGPAKMKADSTKRARIKKENE